MVADKDITSPDSVTKENADESALKPLLTQERLSDLSPSKTREEVLYWIRYTVPQNLFRALSHLQDPYSIRRLRDSPPYVQDSSFSQSS